MSTTKAKQADAVSRLVRETVAQVDAIAPAALRALVPYLKAARDELEAELGQVFASVDPDERFTTYQRTQTLRALEATFERIAELDPAMGAALGLGRNKTGALAASTLDDEVRRLTAIFGDGVPHMPQLNQAAIIAQGDRLLWKRHATSAKRYAGAIGDDIRGQFAIGLAKGETFGQLAQRMRKLDPSVRGSAGWSDAAGDVSDAMFHRWRHWADRVIRTENMHAYNTQHDLAIGQLEAERDEDEEPWLRRWDASADRVTCERCKELDRTVATVDGVFKWGYKCPPAHPYCRCTIVAWRASWGDMKGEVLSKDSEGKDIAPKPHEAKRKPDDLPQDGKRKKKPDELPRASADVPEDGAVLRVKAKDLEARGYYEPEAGLDPVKLEKARRSIREGQREPASAVIGPDGRIEITDGRHRVRAAIEAGTDVMIRFDRGKSAGRGEGLIRVGAPVEKKNPKRVAAAKKAAEASAERRREIHSAVASNLSPELQVAWGKEGHKFMREEAGRIRGEKDRINAASRLSEAFAEKYGSGAETAFGNEGDRYFKRAEIEAEHAESWADEQERKYYEAAMREARARGEIDETGALKSRRQPDPDEWAPPPRTDDDDPPF